MPEQAGTANRFRNAAPAGAAALAIVVAVVGGTVLTRTGVVDDRAPITQEASASPEAILGGSQAAAPEPLPSVSTGPDAPSFVPQPAIPGAAQAQIGAGSKMPIGGVEIVVKFKDDAKIKDIVDTFWKDAPAARRKFDAFKVGRPEFADMKLDRATYSNELVLAPANLAPADATPDKLRKLAGELSARMGKAADIKYAEPNFRAKPGAK
jgi:hypothetical protein